MNFTNQLTNYAGPSLDELAGKKILFANFPGDGHFNPLTGLAVHMKSLGSDVRWYSSSIYASKLNKLQIFHYPFQRAKDVNAENLEQVFPERSQIKGIVKKNGQSIDPQTLDNYLVAEALKTIPLASNQVPYSLINRAIEKSVLPQALEKGMSIIAYSPLQRGLLTGKIKPGHAFGEGDTR